MPVCGLRNPRGRERERNGGRRIPRLVSFVPCVSLDIARREVGAVRIGGGRVG